MTHRPGNDDGDDVDRREDDHDRVVRRFESRDESAVRRLHELALREAGTDPTDVPGTQDLGWIRAAYLDPGGEFLVAERDDRVVAMGGVVIDADVAEVFRVAVHPDHQREGHGSAVMRGLEDAARARGVDRIVLTTARRQDAATDFYPARGYVETGRERQGEYELIHFEKRLTPRDGGGTRDR